MTYLLYIGMFKSGTVTKDGTTLGNPYSLDQEPYPCMMVG